MISTVIIIIAIKYVEMPSDWITDCNFGFYYTVAIPFDDWHSIYGWNTDDNEEELSTYVYLVATPNISYGNDIDA